MLIAQIAERYRYAFQLDNTFFLIGKGLFPRENRDLFTAHSHREDQIQPGVPRSRRYLTSVGWVVSKTKTRRPPYENEDLCIRKRRPPYEDEDPFIFAGNEIISI